MRREGVLDACLASCKNLSTWLTLAVAAIRDAFDELAHDSPTERRSQQTAEQHTASMLSRPLPFQ